MRCSAPGTAPAFAIKSAGPRDAPGPPQGPLRRRPLLPHDGTSDRQRPAATGLNRRQPWAGGRAFRAPRWVYKR